MEDINKIIIIGGGPSGLAAAAVLKRKGFSPVVLDENKQVGDSWAGHYDSLELNSVKSLSKLPFQSMPADYPRYPARDQMVNYFSEYASQQGIEPRFGQCVEEVKRVGDCWTIKTQSDVFYAENIVVATGFNHIPRPLDFAGLASFTGRYLHSHDFRSGELFSGQKVLVVGSGNSAVDIAMDLYSHQANVDLVVRSPTYVTPLNLLGVPAQVTSTLLSKLPLPLADLLAGIALRLRYGDLSKYGIRRPDEGPISMIVKHSKVPMFDRGIIKLIKQGIMGVRPVISKITARNVNFADGSESEYDSIIFATGYTTGLSQVFPDHTHLFSDIGWPLKTATDAGDGLYFIGFDESPRGLLNEISHEALKIADQIGSDSVDTMVSGLQA